MSNPTLRGTPKMSGGADQFLLDDDLDDFEDIHSMIRTNRGYSRAPLRNEEHMGSHWQNEDSYGDSDFA